MFKNRLLIGVDILHIMCFCAVFFVLAGVIFKPIQIVLLILLCFFILFEKNNRIIIAFMIFFFPFASIFKLSPEAMSLFTILQFVFIIRCLFEKKIKKSFFLLYMLFAIFVITRMSNDITVVIKQLCMPLFVYYVTLDFNKKDYFRYSKLFVVSIIIASFIGMCSDMIPNLHRFLTVQTISATNLDIRFSGLWGDPNYYSVNLIIAFVLIIQLQMKKQINMFFAGFTYIIILYFGAQTASKSFLLMFGCVFIFIIYSLFKNHKYFWGIFLTLLFLCLSISILNGNFNLFDRTLSRLSAAEESVNGITSGRDSLWRNYIIYFNDHINVWLIGNGVGANLLNSKAAHNTYIQLIYNYGIFGSFLLVFMMSYNLTRSQYEKNLIFYFPLMIITVMYFFLSELLYLDFQFQIVLGIMSVIYSKNNYKAMEEKTKTILGKKVFRS